MSILLLQCRILPLHGSAVAIDGKAYAVVGESGAGKSTLASAFLHKGFQLLSDDVIAVSLSDTKLPIVIPSYPQQKLWQESLNQLGMKTNGYQPLFERETKFSVPIISNFQNDSLPLAGIFELVPSKKSGVYLYPVSKLQGLDMLYHHTFRQFLISRLGLLEWHFTYTANVIQQIDLFKLKRSCEEFTAEILTEVMLKQIRGGNK